MNWIPGLHLGWLLLLLALGGCPLVWPADASWLNMVGLANKSKIPLLISYDKLNDVLADGMSTDEPNEAFSYLSQLNKQLRPEDSALLRQIDPKAIEQFLALGRVYQELSCDMDSYQLIKDNELATGTMLVVPETRIHSMRTIEQVIRNVAIEHARQCLPVYPRLFLNIRRTLKSNSRYKQMLSNLHDLMMSFEQNSKQVVFHPQEAPKPDCYVLREKLVNFSPFGSSETRAMLNYLKHVTRFDSSEKKYLGLLSDKKQRNKRIVVEHKLVELVEKYIYANCYFLDEQAGHVLTPAAYEQNLYEHKYVASTRALHIIIRYLEYQRVCKELLDARETVERNIIALIVEEDRNPTEKARPMKV